MDVDIGWLPIVFFEQILKASMDYRSDLVAFRLGGDPVVNLLALRVERQDPGVNVGDVDAVFAGQREEEADAGVAVAGAEGERGGGVIRRSVAVYSAVHLEDFAFTFWDIAELELRGLLGHYV